jgi:aquaporin Z
MEAAGLGTFMISACLFGVLLEHLSSPVRQAVADPLTRRALGGLAMGLTLIGIVFSPIGKRSGAHMNPAFTLTFLWLEKIRGWDAVFYVAAQFAGGALGVVAAFLVLGSSLGDSHVNYVATTPGSAGASVAFIAETSISFLMMLVVLYISNTKRLNRFTGIFAGTLVATYITLEAPLSGMSMNPARTFGSAIAADFWPAVWVYFSAPLLGMFLAALAYRRLRGAHAVYCAKFHHENHHRCIFRCRYAELEV